MLAVSQSPAHAWSESYFGDKPGDQEVVGDGYVYSHWDWRNSKDYAFTIDFWDYCYGQPYNGRNWSNCKDVVVTAYIWAWDQEVQVIHAQLPEYMVLNMPMYEGVPGYDNAELQFGMDIYSASSGYPFLYWNQDTNGSQIVYGGNACYPVDHHEGAYPWCGASWDAVGRQTDGQTNPQIAYDAFTNYSVNYVQLWNRPFYTPWGVLSHNAWMKLAMWWEGNQPEWQS